EVEHALLMGVLPVPESGDAAERDDEVVAEPARHRGVVGGGGEKGLGGETASHLSVGPTRLDGSGHFVVLIRRYDHGHASVILGSGADHGRPADVDHLHQIVV